MTDKKPENLNFEEALEALEQLVERMESGELSLEESLKSFEQGVALTQSCQSALKSAEQKIEILTSSNPETPADAFESES